MCFFFTFLRAYHVCVQNYHKNEMERSILRHPPNTETQQKNDAFVSFQSDNGPDYNFIKNILQPELEQETNPPFKLTIHLRDFRADTLIYVNIRNAVVNSNSAIILMSQAYIDSRWCREEFEVKHTLS